MNYQSRDESDAVSKGHGRRSKHGHRQKVDPLVKTLGNRVCLAQKQSRFCEGDQVRKYGTLLGFLREDHSFASFPNTPFNARLTIKPAAVRPPTHTGMPSMTAIL